jgi:hypothetical protein
MHAPLAVMFRGSVIIAVYYWKQNGEKIAVWYQVERLVPVYHKTKVTGLQSFLKGINLHHGQVMVVARRKFGNIFRK